MQKKLNEDFIDSYCEKFASKVTASVFVEDKKVINGKEILKVTPSRQVNFFIIKLLFRYWQEETKKLESPFFNYKHEEVRQAMVQFMNVLSQHIEINQEKFETLLNHAVKDTLYLAALPQAYVQIDMDSRGVDKITERVIDGTIKYLTIHKKEISQFLSDMKGLTLDDMVDELTDEFDSLDVVEAVNTECELLTEVLEINADKVFSDDPDIDDFDEDNLFEPGEEDLVDSRPERVAPEARQEEADIVIDAEDTSMTEESMEEDAYISPEDEPEPLPAADERMVETEPDSYTDDDEEYEDEPEESYDEEESEEEPVEEEEEPPISTLSEEEEAAVNDTINKQFEKKEETIADHLESTKKGNAILEIISLNHRYMFIRELFGNDKNEFESALNEIESYDSFDAAVEFLVQGHAKHNEWDMQSDEVKEFLKVLFRYFR